MATILVIEDSEGQRAEVRAALDSSRLFDRVIEAHDGIEGLKLFLAESPDLVLCDLEMPGLDGEKLLRMRKNAGEAESAPPFLVLTGVTDPARRARLLESGASDTITKPFHTADLIARIALHLKLVQAQRELIVKNRELERMTRTDSLTNLANRRQMDEVLEGELRRSRRYKMPFAIAMADIDLFKSVNDEHGHLVGDAVLIGVADSLREMIRESDCAARFGGEEFLAVLGNNDAAGAEVFANRWRRGVEGMKYKLDDGDSVSVTISVGVASWSPEFESPASLIRAADVALYRAKAGGRNRVCAYSADDEGAIGGASGDSTGS